MFSPKPLKKNWCRSVLSFSRKTQKPLKGELGELEFYFRKIPLHQQKILVVPVLSDLPWLLRNLKNGPK